MRCPQCQHDSPSGARFCNACGRALVGACRACGHVNPEGSHYCSECGQVLTPAGSVARAPRGDTPGEPAPVHIAQRVLSSPKTLEGERKQVTVLFADMKGSMELMGDRDPEDARRLFD